MEVTGVSPKEGLTGLILSPMEDSCIALMHLEILKHLLEWPHSFLELCRKKQYVFFAVYATNPADNPQSGLCKGLLRYQELEAELICQGEEDMCGNTWVQGTCDNTSTQSP